MSPASPTTIGKGEDQGRAVVATSNPDRVRELASAAQLFSIPVGTTGGDSVVFDLVDRGGEQKVSITDLRTAHEGFFPALMQA